MLSLDLRSPSLSGSSGLITPRPFYHNSLVRHEDLALVTQRLFDQHVLLHSEYSTIAALISGTQEFAGYQYSVTHLLCKVQLCATPKR